MYLTLTLYRGRTQTSLPLPTEAEREEMKFGHELSSAEQDAPKEFQGHFLQVRSAVLSKDRAAF